MALTAAANDAMLDHLGGLAVFASLHSADPGTTGASELVAGVGGYARKAITWNAATASNLDNLANPEFDVPAGSVSHFGLWSAATGGTFYVGGALSATEVFAAQGTYILNVADVSLT